MHIKRSRIVSNIKQVQINIVRKCFPFRTVWIIFRLKKTYFGWPPPPFYGLVHKLFFKPSLSMFHENAALAFYSHVHHDSLQSFQLIFFNYQLYLGWIHRANVSRRLLRFKAEIGRTAFFFAITFLHRYDEGYFEKVWPLNSLEDKRKKSRFKN